MGCLVFYFCFGVRLNLMLTIVFNSNKQTNQEINILSFIDSCFFLSIRPSLVFCDRFAAIIRRFFFIVIKINYVN